MSPPVSIRAVLKKLDQKNEICRHFIIQGQHLKIVLLASSMKNMVCKFAIEI